MPEPPTIQVAIQSETAYMRVAGRGCLECSGAFRRFRDTAVERGVHRFVIDMAECAGMDSTFMGELAGLSRSLMTACGGPVESNVVLVNLSDKNQRLLSGLGVSRVVTSYGCGATPERIQDELAAFNARDHWKSVEGGRHTAEGVLEAHETLSDLSEENAARFRDVVEFLREEVPGARNAEE